MVPSMHPMMRRGEMEAPGAFAMSYPLMTAMGFFMLHMLYGVLVGTFSEALARGIGQTREERHTVRGAVHRNQSGRGDTYVKKETNYRANLAWKGGNRCE